MSRSYIAKNPLGIAKAPRVEEDEIEPLDAEEVQQILEAALDRRKFVIALALGTRQGESLALKWDYLDERRRTLRIRKALQRQTWQHGCSNQNQCARSTTRRSRARRTANVTSGLVLRPARPIAPTTPAGVRSVALAAWSRWRSSPGPVAERFHCRMSSSS